jgi:flagellar M-ring protein FliF
MNDALSQFANLVKELPLAKKVSIVFTVMLLVAGFATMFFWANKVDYQVLFKNLAQEDAGAIIAKLKDKKVPYKLEGNGSLVMVPSNMVQDLRLSLAGEGLPNQGQVGYEIFDKADFRTTRFVQDLNFKRALQGELSRTINRFKEVRSSKVFIVLPKQTLFVEDSKPATASIQLDLHSNLVPGKVAAIVHLVASAVEGLEPEQVTVVDTQGRVIFKSDSRGENAALLNNSQLDYQKKIEDAVKKNIQSMLEGIVGTDKALVRVNAQIDFNKITMSEEEYDSAAPAVRSRRDLEEAVGTGGATVIANKSTANQQSGVVPNTSQSQNGRRKKESTINYEINKITRAIIKPGGNLLRLSVAAVIDGTYKSVKQTDGTIKRDYVPRSNEELAQFEEIVKRAMGFSDDREDQVTVSSMPFSQIDTVAATAIPAEDGIQKILEAIGAYRKTIVNIGLLLLIFFMVVRPLLKSVKTITKDITPQPEALPVPDANFEQIAESAKTNQRERIIEISQKNPERTAQMLKGWISE